MDGPDPRPSRSPPQTGVARVGGGGRHRRLPLTQLGSQALRTAWTLPSDFVAPAAFPDAVHALERLVGAKATPLSRHRLIGDSRVTGGFAVSVPSAWAERLVAMAQPRFLRRVLSVPRGAAFREGAPLRPRSAVSTPRPL